MATECTQEAILQFLTERGGRVKNTDLIDHFKPIFPDEHERKAVIREKFKSYVDNIAFVKIENGVKFVCVKKKYRYSIKYVAKESGCVGNGTSRPGAVVPEEQERISSDVDQSESMSTGRTEIIQVNNETGMGPPPPRSSAGEVRTYETAACGEAQQKILPVSGYGNDCVREVRESLVSTGAILADKTEDIINCHKFACIVQKVGDNTSEFDMGNIVGFRGEKNISRERSILKTHEPVPEIPQIAVIEASPLPAAADGSMFTLPGYHSGPMHDGTPGQVDMCVRLSPEDSVDRHIESESVLLVVSHGSHKANQSNENEADRHRTSRGSQRSSLSSHPSDDGADEGQFDSHSLSGSEGNNTQRSSRKNFIEHMMNSSPQVRRSMALRNSTYLSTSNNDMARSDSDTASLVSSNADEDGAAVTLDPLEHQWMMCASDGEWDSLHHLLGCEPNLIWKKDFITGFTCLHWAAKQGKPELLALIVNFAKQHSLPIDINARSSAGYTPLHLAAMHNHEDVVKLLVGAYDADVEIRDYNGKKASQYLRDNVTLNIRDIIGAYGDSDSENTDAGDGGRSRFSRVFHSNLKPLKLLKHNEHNPVDRAGHPRQKVLRRKSSLSKMKPKLQKIRFRTSQIVHSTSFSQTEELEGSLKGSFQSRPKSDLFG